MAILDAWGQPIRPAEIKTAQTARVARYARPWHESSLKGLKPATVARLLGDADAGDLPAQARLFADMLDRDAMIAAAMQQRALAVARLAWKLTPPPDASASEKRALDACSEWLSGMADALEDTAVALMEAVGFGYAACELTWRYDAGQWLPDIWQRPHDWLTASDDGRALNLAVDAGSEPLRPFGWIVHQPKVPRAGYLARGGMFRALVWPFVYKSYAIGDFAEFLETFGLPFVIGKYGREATEEDKARLLSAVASLSHDARAIMPLEMQLEIQRVNATGSDSPHLAMVRWADEAIARAILGQTLSTQARSTGLGSGVADLQAEVRADIRDADARQLAATLTRDLIYPWCALNFGLTDLRRCPRLIYDTAETEDIAVYAEALPKLAAAGVKIPEAWARRKLGIPDAAGEEPVLGGQAATGEPVANRMANLAKTPGSPMASLVASNVGKAEAAPQPDALDALVEEALSDWQPLVEPAARRMQAIVDQAVADGVTAAELIERLAAALPELPIEALAGSLARAQFVARIAGMEGRDG